MAFLQFLYGHQNFILSSSIPRLPSYWLRQISDVNQWSIRHHASIANDVLQLADVARPRIDSHPGLRSTRYARQRLLVFSRKPFEEIPFEQRQILSSVHHARQGNLDHG